MALVTVQRAPSPRRQQEQEEVREALLLRCMPVNPITKMYFNNVQIVHAEF